MSPCFRRASRSRRFRRGRVKDGEDGVGGGAGSDSRVNVIALFLDAVAVGEDVDGIMAPVVVGDGTEHGGHVALCG